MLASSFPLQITDVYLLMTKYGVWLKASAHLQIASSLFSTVYELVALKKFYAL